MLTLDKEKATTNVLAALVTQQETQVPPGAKKVSASRDKAHAKIQKVIGEVCKKSGTTYGHARKIVRLAVEMIACVQTCAAF
ncbi:unnamed protein product [Caenorhabditis auriculariae]|uniref:Uncharacterized protein n=1 Tax=Caenorhabditis auriculariae TaxID=2777116 RepID=A0A8S1HAV2_9PELO|nr:unnamed protein product [Caenorhabditis auriculariae]